MTSSDAPRLNRILGAWGRLLVLACLLAFVGDVIGCASDRPRRVARPGGNPVGFVQRGVASWYGPGFHGNATANGERYDMHRLTAAHKTLPMGSVVAVHSLTNGRHVTVRINDRGPFVKGRIIDLSHKAAEDLGMAVKGTDRVEIEVIDYRPHPSDVGLLRIQVGSFADREHALALKSELEREYRPVRVVTVELDEGTHYRVLVGQFQSARRADALAEELSTEFDLETLVIRDNT